VGAPLNGEKMEVKFIDKMGSDLSVVNAARVSFSKTSEWESIPEAGPVEGFLSSQDEKLINYLAKHNHWSPFGHASMQLHIKAPVFVARQLVKHQVGLVWNEVSRRYVDDEVEFYEPDVWRGAPVNAKQGSSDVGVDINPSNMMVNDYKLALDRAKWTYEHLLGQGVAPEQARMVLPQSMMTEWYWSGTLMAFARVCNLRCKSDTQLETQMVANQIDEIGEEYFPYSWKALTK
jgi:thymidylate synthase (FAD)|tara:strand:- start:47 stop:745 length:699 start_codon:yes stop_codon:yes gene_type:complete